jgi:hypothetical protein
MVVWRPSTISFWRTEEIGVDMDVQSRNSLMKVKKDLMTISVA